MWLGFHAGTGLDWWLDVSTPPRPADVIVCLGGGTTNDSLLPIDRGWQRVFTTAQLFADGYAPAVIVSGGGDTRISEAEVYAQAAEWLGVPKSAVVLDPTALSTADHPTGVLRVTLPNGQHVNRDMRVIVVTSAFHTRRALLTFEKAGFTHVQVVSYYMARHYARLEHSQGTALPDYVPTAKPYDDFFTNAAYGFRDFFTSLREFAALAWYWYRGWI